MDQEVATATRGRVQLVLSKTQNMNPISSQSKNTNVIVSKTRNTKLKIKTDNYFWSSYNLVVNETVGSLAHMCGVMLINIHKFQMINARQEQKHNTKKDLVTTKCTSFVNTSCDKNLQCNWHFQFYF
jgi:hypothetical protein